MTLMNLLPGYVQDAIRDPKHPQRRGMRADLLVIPEAEAAGWSGNFRNDHWHNGATFAHGDVHVWSTGRDWRRATLDAVTNRYIKPEVFPENMQGLRDALGLEA